MVTDGESIDFWLKIYTPVSTSTVSILKQTNHFDFVIKEVSMEFNIHPTYKAIREIPNHIRWFHVAAGVVINKRRSYLVINDSPLAEIESRIDSPLAEIESRIKPLPDYTADPLVIRGEVSPNNARFVYALKELRIWQVYKSPGELRGLRYRKSLDHNMNLAFYLPLDDSISTVTEVVSNIKYPTKNYWLNSEHDYYIDEYLSSTIQKTISIIPINGIKFPISKGNLVYGEYTLIFWVRTTEEGSISIGIKSGEKFIITIEKKEAKIEFPGTNCRVEMGPLPIEDKVWAPIGFIRSEGSYAVLGSYSLYLDSKLMLKFDLTITLTAPCIDPSDIECMPHNYPNSLSHCMHILQGAGNSGYLVRYLKMFGIAMNVNELLAEMHREGDTSKYLGYLRHYWPLDEYNNNNVNNYPVNYMWMVDLSDPDWSLEKYSGEVNALGNSITRVSNTPITICTSNELYNTELGKCVSGDRALAFARDITHSITVESSAIGQNFIVEFWINMAKTEIVSQDIMRCNNFVIRFEPSSQFSVTMFSETLSEGLFLKAEESSPINKWIHVSVGNSEGLSRIALYVDKLEYYMNNYVQMQAMLRIFVLSSDMHGFSGMMRELRFWNEFRSIGQILSEMHLFQWDTNGLNFNLRGYFPLNEGSGHILHNYHSITPKNARFHAHSSMSPPFWSRDTNLPILCGIGERYDYANKICKHGKQVLKVSRCIELPVSKEFPFRDWTFHTWIKYIQSTDTKILAIKNLFKVTKLDSGGKLDVIVKFKTHTKNSVSSVEITFNDAEPGKWYHLTVGYSSFDNIVVFEHSDAVNNLVSSEDPSNPSSDTEFTEFYSSPEFFYRSVKRTSTYYGLTNIKLCNGHFMHVSFWKKYQRSTSSPTSGGSPLQYESIRLLDPYYS